MLQRDKLSQMGNPTAGSAFGLAALIWILADTMSYAMPPAPSFALVADPGAALSQDGGVSRGVAWGDVNNDGYPDLAVANTDGGPVFLYVNHRGERFERVTDGDAAALSGRFQSVAWTDIDNDGWLDLFVTAEDAANLLFRNTGTGELQQIEAGDLTADIDASAQACWADFDLDGWLDVYVVNRDGEPDRLYRNLGRLVFEQVEGPWKTVDNHGRSCAVADPDGNGRPDIYVANAYRRIGEANRPAENSLYLNFADGFRAHMRGEPVNVRGYSYAASWADWDDDGDEDLLVTDIGRFEPNYLYENLGDLDFAADRASALMRQPPAPAKGHVWADFDHDGDLDLFLAEGHGGARPEHAPFDNVNSFFENTDDGFRAADIGAATRLDHVSAGAAGADMDRDGDIDLFIANWFGGDLNNEFYRNRTDGAWIAIRLIGQVSNRLGVGAHVRIDYRDGETAARQYRTLWLNTGYGSMNAPLLHFGLGEADTVESVQIEWPSGVVDIHRDIAARHLYAATEGGDMRVEP